MTSEELDRLAALIAQALEGMETRPSPSARGQPRVPRRAPVASWVSAPVGPEPPSRGGEPPAWSGASQSLGDLAPIREAQRPRHRADPGEMAVAVRTAAAGKGPPVTVTRGTPTPPSRRRVQVMPIAVPLGVSNRHIHLSADHLRALFGPAPLTPARSLLQPGQFAAKEVVAVEGPKGRLDHVRIVGPARGETQVELALGDAVTLGIEPPVAVSGQLAQSLGGVTLIGPSGRVALSKGVIVAARHLHLSPTDAERWGLRDGDRLAVHCGRGARAVTFRGVLVRSGDAHATELHLDVDEGRAAGVATGDTAQIVEWRGSTAPVRILVTERDVVAIAQRREAIPGNAILTPSARDRAQALGLRLP
jgi:putative phosphotransacetylase